MKKLLKSYDRDYKPHEEGSDKENLDRDQATLVKSDDGELILPLSHYEDVIQNRIKVKVKPGKFRSAKMKKFLENFEIVERLFMEEDKDLDFVAKWLRMSVKDLRQCIIKYFNSKHRTESSANEQYLKKLKRKKDI